MLSEYEKYRERNLAERAQLLERLQLPQVAKQLKDSVKKKMTVKSPTKRKYHNKFSKWSCSTPLNGEDEPQPLRRSERLSVKYTLESSRQSSLKTDSSRVVETPKQRPIRRRSLRQASKSLKDFSETSQSNDEDDPSETIQGLYRDVNEEHRGEIVFEKWEGDYAEILTQLKRAEYIDKFKVAQGRGTAMCFHPSPNWAAVIIGDHFGNIGFANITNSVTDIMTCPTWQSTIHDGVVSCLRINENVPNVLFSCSHDGSVNRLDFEKGEFENVVSFAESEDSCRYFDFYAPNVILIALRESPLLLLDTREGKKKTNKIAVPEVKLRMVNVHPTRQDYFMTASSSGSAKIYDMRNTKTFLYDLTESRAVKAAFFSPITGTRIVTTSMDNNLNVWKYEDYDYTKNFVRHNNQTGRFLTEFLPNWHPKCEDIFVCGSLEASPRRVMLFNSSPRVVHEYFGASSVCSLNIFHPEFNLLCGINSSGYLHIWAPNAIDN